MGRREIYIFMGILAEAFLILTRSLNFLNLPNPSSRTMALGFIQPVTEMSTRSRKIMFLGSRKRLVHCAANLTTIY
jgi:hypothetical protein